jgi:DNA repair protein RadC
MKLKEAGKTVDVDVVDSMVIGKGKYYSMRQEGVCE